MARPGLGEFDSTNELANDNVGNNNDNFSETTNNSGKETNKPNTTRATNKGKKTSNSTGTGSRGRNSSENSSTANRSKSNGNGAQAKGNRTLEDLFEENLKDVYSAETQLVAAMPAIAEAAYSEDLQDAFDAHLQETKRHIQRLEKIFSKLGIDKSSVEKCAAMEGLIKEAKKIVENFAESPVRDSALIIGAQKIEHYEIAAYGSLCELADVLGHASIMDVLGRSLNDEEQTDKDLTEIAKSINDEAYESERY